MIVVRDIFRLKFGQSKDAIAHWKEAARLLRESGYGASSVRLLTDLSGAPYYTLVLSRPSTHSATGKRRTWPHATTLPGKPSTARSFRSPKRAAGKSSPLSPSKLHDPPAIAPPCARPGGIFPKI